MNYIYIYGLGHLYTREQQTATTQRITYMFHVAHILHANVTYLRFTHPAFNRGYLFDVIFACEHSVRSIGGVIVLKERNKVLSFEH